MSLSSLLVFALTLIVAAGSPGPSIAALVTRTLSNGFRDVFPFLLAMWFGEALWLTFAVAGLSMVAQAFGMVFMALKFLGAAYLLFLAWKMWTSPVGVSEDALPAPRSWWRMASAGLMVTLGNPKIMVFYVALLPTIIDLGRVGAVGWLELTATMLMVLAMVDCSWIFLAIRARRFLANRKAVRAANRTGAVVMAGAAVAIAAR